jgi:methionine-rich copper-binding protein CopC
MRWRGVRSVLPSFLSVHGAKHRGPATPRLPRRLVPWVVGLAATAVVSATLNVVINAPAAVAAPCDPPIANPIVCENSKPGNPPSEWDISGAGSSTIQGFATDISVDQGQTVQFKVDTPASAYRLDIYRMGYYGGQGARQITTVNPSASLPQNQPNCLTQSTTGLIDCGNWAVSASWSVPVDAVSGIYFAKLARTDGTAGSSHIFFVVRDDDGRSDVLFQTSDTTWQAYNQYGGNSLYVGQPAGRAYKVSYNRPFTTRSTSNEDWLFNSEYPAVRFLEANGYNVSYFTGVDTDRRGSELLEHKAFLSVGHDEYWSGQQRTNVEAARDAGVNLAFLSGNEIFWKTRWENSISAGGTAYRTLVTYKETHANAVIDPQDPPTWTGTWMDPRFSPPADGGRPQNRLSGQLFAVNCCTYQMQASAADSALRLWRSTRVASLTGNQTTTLGDSLIGYEWDESPDNGFRPPGLIHLSSTTINADQVLTDYGTNYGPRTATHHLSLYRAPSGALVFGAGTVQWAWGLDDQHDRGTGTTSDVAVKQATVNLLADMGIQPATLQTGLIAATQTTDTTPPTSTITSPANGATVPVNQPLTISGTASDTGGIVGGVEVSVDGGTTWHPGNGRTNWTYTFTPTTNGQITIKSRATDDSARMETPGAGITVTAGSGPVSCPCTIWSSGQAPTNPADPDTAAVELGVKFRADQNGFITGVRFYKGTGNTGTHVGNLWTSAGTLLATAAFTGETSTGWQQVDFASPVAITANTTYVASYYTPSGHYAADTGAFATSGVTRGPLTALQDGISGGNGVYRYGTGGGFPSNTFQSTNYWMDVVFNTSTQDTTPPTLTARTPAPGATGVPVGASVTATFSEAVQENTITVELRDPTNALVSGVKSYDVGTRTVTFTPGAALAPSTTYTATVSGAKDTAGNTMAAVSWSFTTGGADTTPPTVVGRSPAPNATGVPTTSTVTATFSEAVQSSTIVMELRGPGNTLVGSSTAYNSGTLTATLTPSAALAQATQYTATVSGAKDAAGNTMTAVTWTFTTGSLGCPCTIWPSTTTPQTAASNDSRAVEIGVKFRASQSGLIKGIRFYKGTGNTGTHVGHLWTSSGTLLGTVTFSGETSAGWQQATFASPVSIAANTTYVASYYAPVGRYAVNNNYFTTAITNGPLTALADGTDGGNGVYRYGTGGGFPTNTHRSSNYWVDIVFDVSAGADTTPPTVISRTPAPGATGVAPTTTVTATFDEDVQPATIAMELRGPGTTLVPSSISYNAGTRLVTLTPNAALAASTVYTVNLSGAKDTAGNTMTTVSWSFTTASGAPACPCTIWPNTATPANPATSDSSSVELGVRFRADRDGYITGIRFYKGTGNTGTHVGNLWTNTGTNLASVIFSGETASGWQQATFSAPVPISVNTTYVASYHAPAGQYAADSAYFATAGTTNGPLTALQNGLDGANGVYLYGAGGFPTTTFQSSNYWVDVVFQTSAADTTPPTIMARTPAVGASGVPVTTSVTATFSEAVQESTIAVDVRDPSNNSVAGVKSYDAASRTVTFTPSSQLAASTTYTANVSGAKDIAGNTMAPVSWSFTTAAPPPPPPSDGPGGPIAVVTSGTNPYSQYLAEILRAEGFNEFSTIDAGSLSASALAPYDVVIVGEVSLTSAQATTLSAWVGGGGNLIAMRPDSDLNALLGIVPASGTLADGYIKIDTTTAPGAGVTADTMQFHGTANRYTLSGAQTIATLYSNATTATTNPAVTLRSVGTNGGEAASFTYDLARSVVYTRQGNPAWAGQERDGISPRRSDDLYFGGSTTDWVNLNKVAIPQADEQQRLLANLIEVMNRDRKPMPRFWYLPDSRKAVVVGTGDDHARGGTSGRFNDLIAASPAGCSVANWQCLRYTSYVYPGSLSSSAANSYVAQGFEVALHEQNGCADFGSPADLEDTYATEISDFRAAYPNLPPLRTNRFHCLVWSDWSSQATTELAHGMRLDANYYYWPGNAWIHDRPGFMTGSGLPMRFTDSSGAMIDVYQSATVMTDESDQTYPFTANTLLDNALGPLGYYGAFTANMHTDNASTFDSDQLMASALAHNVAIISANQLLTWTDGRNGSSFGNLSYSGNTLTFSVAVGSGANGLTGMLPVAGPGGVSLTSLSRGGSPVSFTTTTVKGQAYAMFAAAAGSYTATYSPGGGALALSAATVQASSDGTTATIAWKSGTPASTAVVYDAAGPAPELVQAEATSSLSHSVTLDQLKPGRTYSYRLISVDSAGRSTTWPKRGQPAAKFTTPAADTTAPTIARIAVRPLPDGTAMVTWRTNEPASSRVTFGTSKTRLTRLAIDDKLVRQHAVVVTGLNANATYWFSVSSTDEAGNATKSPKARRFVSAGAGVADQSSLQFMAGKASGVTVSSYEFGAITLSARAKTGTFVSHRMDAQAMVTWDRGFWYGSVPAGATVKISVRTGSTATPDSTWSRWAPLTASGDRVVGDSRYIQYRVELTSSKGGKAPVLTAIGFTHNGNLPGSIGESGAHE